MLIGGVRRSGLSKNLMRAVKCRRPRQKVTLVIRSDASIADPTARQNLAHQRVRFRFSGKMGFLVDENQIREERGA